MTDEELSVEERILRMMKRVLTDIAKDTYTKPGFRHPLSDHTIQGMRDCLSLIAARERELAEAAGRPMNMRPVFKDGPMPPREGVVVQIDALTRGRDKSQDED